MINPYIGLLLMILAAGGFLLGMLAMASWLGPKNRTPTKQLPFECGAVSIGDLKTQRVDVRFYLVAVLFLLFDVEVVFLYPWSVVLKQIGWPAFMSMLTFVLVLAIGLVYVWRNGVLDWNK